MQSQEQATRAAIDRFSEAFSRHDADALAAYLTEDTVFEDTSPAPDGPTMLIVPCGASRARRRSWTSGADGSPAMPTRASSLRT